MLKWLRSLVIRNAPAALGAGHAAAGELMRRAFPLHQAGRLSEAAALYRQILEHSPGDADALYLLGLVSRQEGDPGRAATLIGEAILQNPGVASFHLALGELRYEAGEFDAARASFQRAAQLDPERPDALNLLGCSLKEIGRLDEAERSFQRALELSPDFLPALKNLSATWRDLGRTDEALDGFRRLLPRVPDRPEDFSDYLFTLNLCPGIPRETVFAEHRRYDERFGAGRLGSRRPVRQPDPGRRLHVAYFSPDLRAHAVSYFIEPVLAHHDRARFEVGCYYLYPRADEVTARLKRLADRWIDCAHWTDQAIADRIEADGVDLLVDLAGHTAWNRLPVLARKPAPVQATWLGYLNTTGLSAMDYRLTDACADPEGETEACHSERLVRLPHGQWCYQRPHEPIGVGPLPAASRGAITFGSFNKFSKLSPPLLEAWALVLREIDDARLLLAGVPAGSRARLLHFFSARGIDASRLEMHDRTDLRSFRMLHHSVDIALDAHPYSGATTTCDSLWMGVPVLTMTGPSSISRSSASLLNTLGLADWVTNGSAALVERARAKSSAVGALAALRGELRGRMEASAIMDGRGFTRDLEEAYREMWRECCARQ